MEGEISQSLDGIKAVFLDLDGTIYLGDSLIDGALDFLGRLEARGIKRYFLSNNSSKSVEQYVGKLRDLGIDADKDEVLLSTHDLISWLSKKEVTSTFLVGTEGMRSMLEEEGIETSSEQPEFVVLGYDTEISYEKLATASIHLHEGVQLVASHPDMVCPSPRGTPRHRRLHVLVQGDYGGGSSACLWQAKQRNDSTQGGGFGAETF